MLAEYGDEINLVPEQPFLTRAKSNSGKTFAARNQKHLQKLADKKFEENCVGEVSAQKSKESKRNLKEFVLQRDLSDCEERQRLLLYFAHRSASLVKALMENFRARKLSKTKAPVVCEEHKQTE